MDEEKNIGRKSKVNREEILQTLKKIGSPGFPRGFTQRKNELSRKKEKPTHYLTSGLHVGDFEALQIEEEFKLAYRLPSVQNIRVVERQRKKGAFRSLHTYRSRLEALKPARLFVPSDFVVPGKSITEDIDPEFFSIISGNAVKDRGSIRELTWAVRNSFRSQQQSGYLQDEVLKLNQQRKLEEKVLQEAEVALQRQIEGFEKFLQEDHAASAKLLEEAEEATAERIKEEERLAALEKETEKIKTKVVLLGEQWQQAKLLQKFLFNLAPLPWRRLHDVMHKKGTDIDPEGSSVFERVRGSSITGKEGISAKIARIAIDSGKNEPTALYFDQPEQLFELFKDLEERNVGLLLQCEQLKPSVRTMKRAARDAADELKAERTSLEQDVADLRALVSEEQAKAQRLEAEAKRISQNHLHKLITERRAVSITACVEDAYERIIGPNDRNFDALAMMRAVEEEFHRVQLDLDIQPINVVKKISRQWEMEQKRIMNEAKDASKKVHQMERLTKKLTNALKPWIDHPKRRLVKRSEPPKEKMIREPPPPPLTTSQLEQRHFFEDTEAADMYRPMA